VACPSALYQVPYRFWLGWGTFTMGHSPVEIGHPPGLGGGFCAVAWNQVQMQVTRPLAEGEGVHPITAREGLHQPRRLLHSSTPVRGFLRCEGDRTRQVAARIQQ